MNKEDKTAHNHCRRHLCSSDSGTSLVHFFLTPFTLPVPLVKVKPATLVCV